ncbi:unknown [Crocosphaera subtropica ATCC 51142]|uniref:HEAT repeat domain-containing protein n=1 Tax=Crocosphaera subtropica (strain ATCC 51142 / BH68) TaxID=43989 RepID=B1WUJ6_CROS5|nr:HEAT repeat domain-containing protein [Crocosphaera subtropica]ACB53850.1 unknown [Crocosphaera subtropica ATCC 51142]
MNDFLLTLFLLLVILSLYSVFTQRKESQQKSSKKPSASTAFSRASELSSEINTSKINFFPSQPPPSSSSALSSTNSTITSQSNHPSLAQNIKDWGDSNSSYNIPPLLNYLTHSDPSIRIGVAEALGKLVSKKNIRSQMRQGILGLGRLSRDPVLSVRLSAVKALSQVKTPLVIPFLKLAQKDANNEVVKKASAALNYFKSYPSSSQKKVTNKPKNVVKQLSSR